MRIIFLLLLLFVFVSGQSQVVSDTTKSKSTSNKNFGNALVVIDGIEQKKRGIQHLDSTLRPEQIASLIVLKDKAAIDKYGEKGKDGVIELMTKKDNEKLTAVKIEEEWKNSDSSKGFSKVESQPAFRGGEKAYKDFLMRNLNANVPYDNGAPEGTYTVVLQFMVDKDGSISDLKALTKHGFGMEEECIRILKLSSWVPAVQNGRIVKAYKKQPITYVVRSK